MSNESEWIPALEAAKMLARKFGGLTIAKQGLALGLREGLLRARATWVMYVKEGEEEPSELEATPQEPIEIPAETWSVSVNWDADRLSWDWEYGCFDVEGFAVEDDKSFGEVTFLREEVEAIHPEMTPYNSLHQSRPVKAAMEDLRTRRAAAPRKWAGNPPLRTSSRAPIIRTAWNPSWANLNAASKQNSKNGLRLGLKKSSTTVRARTSAGSMRG